MSRGCIFTISVHPPPPLHPLPPPPPPPAAAALIAPLPASKVNAYTKVNFKLRKPYHVTLTQMALIQTSLPVKNWEWQ